MSDLVQQLRSPLASVKGAAALLRRRGDELTPTQRQQLLTSLDRQADRLLRLVDELEADTRRAAGPSGQLDHVSLAEVVRGLRSALPGLDFQVLGRSSTAVVADPGHVLRVLKILLRNAAEHGDGAITVSWSQDDARGLSRIQVSDEGPGVVGEQRDRIFREVWDGREARGGGRSSSGGLAQARRLAEANHGSLDLTSSPVGAVFTLTLPLAPGAASTSSGQPAERAASPSVN